MGPQVSNAALNRQQENLVDISLWMTFVTATVLLVIISRTTVVFLLPHALTQGRRVALSDFIGMALSMIAMGLLTATLRKTV